MSAAGTGATMSNAIHRGEPPGASSPQTGRKLLTPRSAGGAGEKFDASARTASVHSARVPRYPPA